MRSSLRVFALALLIAQPLPSVAAEVGRAVSALGPLNVTAFNVNADGDAFPNADLSPVDAPDGINDSGATGTGGRFDSFGIFQRSADSISRATEGGILNNDLMDDTAEIFPNDVLGIIAGGTADSSLPPDTAPFFGVQDLQNPDNAESTLPQQATWTFNLAGATGGLKLSVDVAHMGDSEPAPDDVYKFEVSFDNGSTFTPVLQSTGIIDTSFTTISGSFAGQIDVAVAGQEWVNLPNDVKYVLQSGKQVAINDPLTFEGVALKNTFQTFSAEIGPAAPSLIVRFSAVSNGGSEPFAFRNLIIEDGISAGLAGDYNSDGMVDAADYAVWRDGDSPDSTEAGYTLWVNNFGNPGAASATGAPEPTGALLALVAGCGLLAARRHG